LFYRISVREDTNRGEGGHEPRRRVTVNNNKGYIDKTGKLVIAAKYNLAEDFSDGLAMVFKDRRYGFVDKAGNEVIPPQYEQCYSFKNGLAIVYVKNKAGYIDKKGTRYWEE
jgi:WG containing repeat